MPRSVTPIHAKKPHALPHHGALTSRHSIFKKERYDIPRHDSLHYKALCQFTAMCGATSNVNVREHYAIPCQPSQPFQTIPVPHYGAKSRIDTVHI